MRSTKSRCVSSSSMRGGCACPRASRLITTKGESQNETNTRLSRGGRRATGGDHHSQPAAAAEPSFDRFDEIADLGVGAPEPAARGASHRVEGGRSGVFGGAGPQGGG